MASMREVAWRVFSGEYNASDLEHSTGEERSASYVVTPLGAKVNRLFLVGVLTDLENVGTDTEPLWRARVSDPTGVFYVSAGQYQPEAAKALSRMKAPSFVAIIGKSRIYRPEDGGLYLSVRPEIVREADEELRSMWVLEACRSLKLRIEAMEEAMKMGVPSGDELKALGYSESVAGGVMLALQHYKEKLDIGHYRSMLKDALKFITPEKRFAKMNGRTETAQEEILIMDEAKKEDPEEKVAQKIKEDEGSGPSSEQEETIVGIISELDTSPKGVTYETIIERSKKEGITQEALEEIFNSLLEKGMIYEPILGRVKLVRAK